MSHFISRFLTSIVAAVWTANAIAGSALGVSNILIVGNSITYTNNLPAILSQFTGADARIDMFVKSGGRLMDLVTDDRLKQAMKRQRYSVVIIQEQGGNDLCLVFGDVGQGGLCKASVKAHLAIANWARNFGGIPYYLGTYQTDTKMSRALVGSEERLAHLMNARYIEISDTLGRLNRKYPGYRWYYRGDLHPGYDLTVLMALKIYKSIYNRYPEAKNVCTTATLYSPKQHFNGLVEYQNVERAVGRSICVVEKREVKTLIDG